MSISNFDLKFDISIVDKYIFELIVQNWKLKKKKLKLKLFYLDRTQKHGETLGCYAKF